MSDLDLWDWCYNPTATRPPILKVDWFGATWSGRGVHYWLRRLALSVLIATELLVLGFIEWTIVRVVADRPSTWFRVIVYGLAALFVVFSHYVGFRDMRGKRAGTRFRRRSDFGPGIVPYGYDAPFIGILGLGWLTAALVYSFARYASPYELRAVERTSAWYRKHTHIPNDQRPKQFRTDQIGSPKTL